MGSMQRSFVIAVDKPAGVTSHDVVAWARRALAERSIGHAGTLDPAATGVLVLAVGEATKLVPYLTGCDKSYEAEIALGVETDTLDADGEVVRRADVPALSIDRVRAAARAFEGERTQRVPRFSAVKVDGERLHRLARAGVEVVEPERVVQVRALDVVWVGAGKITVRLDVAKGFYVRAFARDFAEALGTVGHLASLRRTRSGSFALADAVDGGLLRAARSDEHARDTLLGAIARLARSPADALDLPKLPLDAALERQARHGKPLAHPAIDAVPVGAFCSLVVGPAQSHRLVAIARREGHHLRVVRGFRSEAEAAAP